MLGGTLSTRLPTRYWVWLSIGLRPAEHRDEAWLFTRCRRGLRRTPPGKPKACVGRGLVALVLGNRIHVAPPLNVNDSDAATGLSILDEALAEADTFHA